MTFPVTLALIEVVVLTVVALAFLAGYGLGRAQVAPHLARLVAEVEVARQTGVVREKRSVLDAALGEREPRRLDGSGGEQGTPDGAQAREAEIARQAMIDKGTEKILEDARRERLAISPSEARRMAADMVAEVF